MYSLYEKKKECVVRGIMNNRIAELPLSVTWTPVNLRY